MKWIVFFVLASGCACLLPRAYGQGIKSSDLEKYPDIAYRERVFQLFRFLALDKQNEKGIKPSSKEFQRMDRAVTLISLELTEAGVFINLDKPLRKERLERLSPAARAFYDYYRQALAHNPVFRDLYKPLPVNKAELYLSYRNYQLQARSDGERRTFEAAASVLDDIQDEAAPARAGYGLLIAGGGALLATAGLGLVIVQLRRRVKQQKQ